MAGLERIILDGLRSVMEAQDARADNLANVDTPGFRRRISTSFVDAIGQRRGVTLDPSAGGLEKTDNPLDLALEGEAYLVVAGPGGPAVCRGGSFRRAPDGRLVGPGGAALVGRSGVFRVPDERVEVTQDGRVLAGGREVDSLRRVHVPADGLVPMGAGLLGVTAEAPVVQSSAQVLTGVLESSNVEPVLEMVGMMDNMRRMEMLLQALRAGDEMAERAVTDVGSTRG